MMYADDAVIYYASSDSKSMESTINKDFNKFEGWLQANLLVLNLEKRENRICLLWKHSKVDTRS